MNEYCDLILLDGSFAVRGILEAYTSLRWTRRWFGAGDFELTLGAAAPGAGARYIYNPDTGETAVIESRRAYLAENGAREAVFRGPLLEALLRGRVLASTETLSGNIEAAARYLVAKYAMTGDRAIPKLRLAAAHGYTETTDTAQYEGITLSEALYRLLGAAGLSYSLRYDYEGDGLVFDVLRGVDRTQEQSEHAWAVYSVDYENVLSSSCTDSTAEYANYFYIAGRIASDGSRTVVELDLTGGAPRVERYIFATDIKREYDGVTLTDAQYRAALLERGREAAEKCMYTVAPRGKISLSTPPVFGVDCDIGDCCDYEDNALGISGRFRITEAVLTRKGGAVSTDLLFGQDSNL